MSDTPIDAGLRGALQHFSRVSGRIQRAVPVPVPVPAAPPDLQDAWDSLFSTYLARHRLPPYEQAGAGAATASLSQSPAASNQQLSREPHLAALAASPLFPAWSRVAFASWLLNLEPQDVQEQDQAEDQGHIAFSDRIALTCQALYADEYAQAVAAANADTPRRLAHLAKVWDTTIHVLTFVLSRHGVLGSRDFLLSLGRLHKQGFTLAQVADAITSQHAVAFRAGRTLEPKTICTKAVIALGGVSARTRQAAGKGKKKKKEEEKPQKRRHPRLVQQPAAGSGPGPAPEPPTHIPDQPRENDDPDSSSSFSPSSSSSSSSSSDRGDGVDLAWAELPDQWSDGDVDDAGVDQQQQDREPDEHSSAVPPTGGTKTTAGQRTAPARYHNSRPDTPTSVQERPSRAHRDPSRIKKQEEEAAAEAHTLSSGDEATRVHKPNNAQGATLTCSTRPTTPSRRRSTESTLPEAGRGYTPDNDGPIAADDASSLITGEASNTGPGAEQRHAATPAASQASSPSPSPMPRRPRQPTPQFDFQFSHPAVHDGAAAAAQGLIDLKEQTQTPSSQGLVSYELTHITTIRGHGKKRQRSDSEPRDSAPPSWKHLKKSSASSWPMAQLPAFPEEQDQQQHHQQQGQLNLGPDSDPGPGLLVPGQASVVRARIATRDPQAKGPLLQDVYSSVKELDSGELVGDHIINASIRRLRTNAPPHSASVAIVDSLAPEVFSRTVQTRRAILATFPSPYESIIIPVNDRAGRHWFLCHFCFVEQRSGGVGRPPCIVPTLKVLDPYDHQHESRSARLCAGRVRDWLAWLLCEDARLQQGDSRGGIAIEQCPCPRQPNSFDCGPYIIMFAACITGALPLPAELPDSATMRLMLRQSLFTAQDTLLTQIAAAAEDDNPAVVARRPGVARPQLCVFARRHAVWDDLDRLGGATARSRAAEPTRRVRELEAAEACLFAAALAAERAEAHHRAAIGHALTLSQAVAQLADLFDEEMQALRRFLDAGAERRAKSDAILEELTGLNNSSGGGSGRAAEALMAGLEHGARAMSILTRGGDKNHRESCVISRAAVEAWGLCVAWVVIRRKFVEREEALHTWAARSRDKVGITTC